MRGGAIFVQKIFPQHLKKLLMLPGQIASYQRAETVYIVDNRVSSRIALPDSPQPIIIKKEFWALHLCWTE